MDKSKAGGPKTGIRTEASDGQDVPDQPRGTPDRTRHPDQAFPRDVEESAGRRGLPDADAPGQQGQTTSDGSIIKPPKP